jgi:hypothetical protein
MRSFFYLILIVATLCSVNKALCQTGITRKVLFIGNSYTYANNLPQMIADVASSTGNNLVFDSSAPGGAFLCDQVMFSIYPGVTKIMNGGWDYVVLQDQSLAYTGYVPTYVHCAYRLDTIIKKYNPCSHTMFYVTWGRENGMTFGSYHAMDSVIESNYMLAADSLSFEATPVGAIWRYLRINHPTINLFDNDGSHPSPAGSYAAACGFYTTLFRKDPTQITFNSLLSPTDASIIRAAAKHIVYNNFSKWHIGTYDSLMSSACLGTGISEPTLKNLFKIVPNPASDLLKITYFNEGNINNIQFEIYDIKGQLMQEIEMAGEGELDIRNLLPGMYYMKCKNAPAEIVKFIKL